MRLAHEPVVRAGNFRLFAAADPFAPDPNANLNLMYCPAGSEVCMGLAFGSLDRHAEVRRAGAFLPDASDLLRASGVRR